jgi:hypothetical protein
MFSRLLARIEKGMEGDVVLKGGFALELRLEQARTTRDIDLALYGSDSSLLERLQAIGQADLGDFMTFEIQLDKEHPDVTGDGAVYGGKRFRVECKLAGKVYGARFGLDVALGGKMLGAPTVIPTAAYLDFAGIESPAVRVLPIETHIAEKLHAYTLPRATTNMRVRDLPDIALMATARQPVLIASRIREAIRDTFTTRGTHSPPAKFPKPPVEWALPYDELAKAQSLRWKTLGDVEQAARAFLEPVLGDAAITNWNPQHWQWAAELA